MLKVDSDINALGSHTSACLKAIFGSKLSTNIDITGL